MYKTKLRKSKIYKHLIFHFRNDSSVVPNPIVHYSDMMMVVAIISNNKYKNDGVILILKLALCV